MFHNWIEIRASMIDRQRELLRTAERARAWGLREATARTPGTLARLLLLFSRGRRR